MLALKIIAWLRPDVRIRIRRSVIRIQVKEARIRAIIRIRRHQRPTPAYNRKELYLQRGPFFGLRRFRAARPVLRNEARPRPEVRSRIRRSVKRIQVKEARMRASSRSRRHQRPTDT